MARVFGAEWICVGREEEVDEADDYVVRDVAGESLIVVRSRDGAVRAFRNVCRHRGTRLCDGEGSLRSGVVVCPYHAWTYRTDGALVGTPNVGEGEGLDRSTLGLWPAHVETTDGFVFVNLAERPAPFGRFCAANPEGDIRETVARWRIAELRTAHRIVYEVAANWKILTDNYNECLHCPGVHPELVKLVPTFRKGVTESADGAPLVGGATTLTHSGTSNRPPLPGLAPADLTSYNGNHVYPTLMLNLHSDSVMTYRLEPTGPAHTRIVSEFLFHPDTIAREDFDPTDIVEFWDLVSRQDWAVCERAQLGVTSRAYDEGGVHPFNDRWIVAFNERYRSSIEQG